MRNRPPGDKEMKTKISRLKGYRFLAGKSQDEIAHTIGISQAKLSRIERGYIQPTLAEKKLIAEILDRTPEEIFS